MKRKVVAAVLTMAMAGSLLAGCGSSSSDDSSSKSETTTTELESSILPMTVIPQTAHARFSGVSITCLIPRVHGSSLSWKQLQSSGEN